MEHFGKKLMSAGGKLWKGFEESCNAARTVGSGIGSPAAPTYREATITSFGRRGIRDLHSEREVIKSFARVPSPLAPSTPEDSPPSVPSIVRI